MVLRPCHATLPLLPGLDSQKSHRNASQTRLSGFRQKFPCQNLPPPMPPLQRRDISDSQHAALQQLSTIFNDITNPGPAKIPTPTTVVKTPTVPPGFEPLPISVPAALPRVPSPPSTTPSPLPASLPRVPTQPRPPAPPAPAVNALPQSPTETSQARTRIAGQRRRQQHKAQRAATKQASRQAE